MRRLVSELKLEDGPPFLTISIGAEVSILDAARIGASLAMLEAIGKARVNPPAEGELYYRAFVPNRRWREPAGRPAQPWELHLSREGDALRGEMVWHETVWPAEEPEPRYRRHAFPAPDAAAVLARLETDARERQAAGRRPPPAVLLVYAPPDLTCGQVLSFVRPALKTHGTVYVFPEEP